MPNDYQVLDIPYFATSSKLVELVTRYLNPLRSSCARMPAADSPCMLVFSKRIEFALARAWVSGSLPPLAIVTEMRTLECASTLASMEGVDGK